MHAVAGRNWPVTVHGRQCIELFTLGVLQLRAFHRAPSCDMALLILGEKQEPDPSGRLCASLQVQACITSITLLISVKRMFVV